jgi:mono/diheme cytochrome c family protein
MQSTRRKLSVISIAGLCAVLVFLNSRDARSAAAAQQRAVASSAALSASQVQAVITDYCVTCHNARLKSGLLELDSKDLNHLESNTVAWESVVRKLRTGMMPPKNAKRPDRKTLDAAAAFLENGLDRAAALRPNPGAPALQRMNRTEYANAVRDLLDLKVDVTKLLPSDSTVAGFDNIADVLGTSPTLIQSYVSAAMKISRLAVGDLTAQPAPVTYDTSPGLKLNAHFDGMPLGTNGGLVVQHNFPLDGEYQIQGGAGRVDMTLDGTPVPTGGRGRIPITAGPHTIGVASVPGFDTNGMDGVFSAPAGRGRGMSITINGPYNVTGAGNSPSRRRIFVCTPVNAAAEASCARQILKTLAMRAYRRQVGDSDPSLQVLMRFYTEGRSKGGFDDGIQNALARVLVDPQFIFRMEDAPSSVKDGGVFRLSNVELATRLSFFLWSSIPDDTLLSIAIAGKLSDPAVLEQQTRRMLSDPKAKSLIDNFASEWMHLRELDNAAPESPDFDSNLKQAFGREMELFFESILREDRTILTVLDADYTFVDERLARFYGIPDVKGSFFRRVPLAADDRRRGVLGKGSVLLVTSAANRTSPVQRGQWVLENLLGSRAPNPPPGVEVNLDEKAGASAAKTLRARMEAHRTQPVCASCHNIMDPIGFSLENFDLVGKWRTLDEKSPIDASAEMVDGTRLDGPASLRRALVSRSDAFVNVATEKLLTYATGRAATAHDMPAVRAIARSARDKNYRFSDLILGVVRSDPFQMRMKDSASDAAIPR